MQRRDPALGADDVSELVDVVAVILLCQPFVGDLVFKPRGQWHTFWNPGDTPTRILEDLFRELGRPGGELDPATLPALAARYGCAVDFERTAPIVQRHGLTF